ncbi:uncharacterized protein BT62DRAFT_995269 [Guyanagaster necrorhizus]|uniref:F-box domain-containing protein n=1 Tax=Guyanagaster necrorhizus TaxID=856835 RepID=A0A9P7VQF6_9AGAR|nr:uncharacterized protein BT62DRAFT_995269 [Guyanagaster necrorhizus MCA 3950]KAG7444805.1 hypothetical protein BT62DRAFT_995269 [Guyanagaster necrorhizus MCA 3950]
MDQPYTDRHESQIYAYLRSDFIPTDGEMAQILSDVSFLTKELESTNCNERVKKQKALNIRRSILAPIRRLPVEILLEIFSLLPPERPPSNRHQFYALPSRPSNTRDMPWVLSHVSAFWHATSLASPPLWTHIYIASKYAKMEQFLIQTTLARSQDCPLDLCICMDLEDPECEEIVIKSLTLAAPRCVSLRLDIPAPTLMALSLSCSFPRLQHLELHVDIHPADLTTSVDVFMKSVQLHSVRFMEVRVPEQIQLPLTELHVLSQVFVDSYDQLAVILKEAKGLVSLDAWPSGAYASSLVGSAAEKITHSNLRCLDTGYSALEHLSLPALDHLTLDEDDMQHETEEKMQVLPDFLQRSKCHLRRLRLMHYGRVAKILPLILGSPSFITLTRLDIYVESVEVYALLGDIRLMPQLRHLSICDGFENENETSFFGVCAEPFHAIIEARRNQLRGLTLTSLEVERMTPELLEHIREIAEDGIEVEFIGRGLDQLYPP